MSENSKDSATRRWQRILENHPELLDVPIKAKQIQLGNLRFQLKSNQFYQLADKMKAMLEPFVVCRAGCNYCCHMMTMIYQHEAEAMAKASGRVAITLASRPMDVALNAAAAFTGLPCPFLVEQGCSIYANRPLVCRLHNSLNDDPIDCRILPHGGHAPVASVDPDWVELPYIYSVLHWKPQEPYGAIQEFFPPY